MEDVEEWSGEQAVSLQAEESQSDSSTSKPAACLATPVNDQFERQRAGSAGQLGLSAGTERADAGGSGLAG